MSPAEKKCAYLQKSELCGAGCRLQRIEDEGDGQRRENKCCALAISIVNSPHPFRFFPHPLSH